MPIIIKIFFLLFFSAALSAANTARAVAIYDTLAEIQLTVASIDNLDNPTAGGLTISANTNVIDQLELGGTASGIAAVQATDSGNLQTGDQVTLRTEADGNSVPSGNAESLFDTLAAIQITNPSSDNFEIAFRVSYQLDAAATVDNPLLEQANGAAFVRLLSNQLGDLITSQGLSNGVSADASFGTTSAADRFSFDFSLALLPGGQDLLSLSAFADGLAVGGNTPVTPVPLPDSALLLLTGVGVLTWRRRKAY